MNSVNHAIHRHPPQPLMWTKWFWKHIYHPCRKSFPSPFWWPGSHWDIRLGDIILGKNHANYCPLGSLKQRGSAGFNLITFCAIEGTFVIQTSKFYISLTGMTSCKGFWEFQFNTTEKKFCYETHKCTAAFTELPAPGLSQEKDNCSNKSHFQVEYTPESA